MAQSAPKGRPGIFSDLVNSIFTPGTNSGLVAAMNYSFFALFATLFGMLVLTRGNGHVLAMLGLSVALWASIRWCVPGLSCDCPPLRFSHSLLRRFLVAIADAEEQQRRERLEKERQEVSKGGGPAEVAAGDGKKDR